eukprot:symbB.v1.2.008040.t1/scaffold501.1/size195062/1
MMDAPVLDLVEEADRITVQEQTRKVRREGVAVTNKLDELEGEPAAFRSSRSFAMMLPNCVQVVRLNFKSLVTQRAPMSAIECCTQLAQMAKANSSTSPVQARWSFDDVGVPSFEEQRRHLATSSLVPPVRLGRWLQGLLRFLAVSLRPVWDLPLVVMVTHREKLGMVEQQSLGLGIAEDVVRKLISRLRPGVRFAHTAKDTKTKADPVAASSAARFRLYTERSIQSDAVAQARQTLQSVLEVADRALEVLALLSLLQEQKSAYRVLRSNVLHMEMLQRLQSTGFGRLVETDEALEPAVQLCSAFLVESGLTTPMADLEASRGATLPSKLRGMDPRAGGLCRDLEDQCPRIFRKLDLGSFVTARLGSVAPPLAAVTISHGKESQLELLHRYTQCVTVNSPEDHWASLSNTLRTVVDDHPKRAAEVCVEKLQQLQLSASIPASGVDVQVRVMQLLEALLGAVSSRPLGYRTEDQALATQSLVEQLLIRTSSVHFSKENSERVQQAGTNPVSFVHKAVLEYLLASPPLRPVVEALLQGRSGEGQGHSSIVEAFLCEKAGKHTAAGELLWRHRLRQGRVKEAAEVMLQVASGCENSVDLAQRVRYLDQAKQACDACGI